MRTSLLGAALCLTAALSPASGQEYRPSFHPDMLKGPIAGRPNEVLVLGTPHLSQLPGNIGPEMVEPLLTRLARWKPTAIANENMSGLLCFSLRAQGERQASSVESYCYDPTAAGNAAGLGVPAANAEVERRLANWPASPSPAERRRLALLFLAAGEPTSALVQWLRLPATERRAADGLTTDLAAHLDKRVARKSEDSLIVAALAARLGLERVWGVDDQSSSGAPVDDKAYGAALTAAWDNPATKARIAQGNALSAGLGRPDGLLDLYRAYNAPAYGAEAYRSDWGAALNEPSPQAYGRQYVAYWETRNLRMVANIRAVLGWKPGTRLLAVVGASHKAYYEAYLNQMHDAKLVDAALVLE